MQCCISKSIKATCVGNGQYSGNVAFDALGDNIPYDKFLSLKRLLNDSGSDGRFVKIHPKGDNLDGCKINH